MEMSINPTHWKDTVCFFTPVFDGKTPFNFFSKIAYGYLITVNNGQYKRTKVEDSNVVKRNFRGNSQTCENLALIAALNDLAAVIIDMARHILSITSDWHNRLFVIVNPTIYTRI